VLTRDDAAAAIDAGAEFLVTPVVAHSVIEYANDCGVPVACGAFTPTEMHEAHCAGAAYVKLFPAGRLGPGYVKDVLAPLPHLRIVCVGGIDAANCASYLAAGAYSVGIGGSLVDPADVDRHDWPAIAAKAHACVEACRAAGE
jgi:2-dehydro-3-deoxyphosphogluconate aldolase/(4S)-4-hydroxy-2-oxoglutarate aldolase